MLLLTTLLACGSDTGVGIGTPTTSTVPAEDGVLQVDPWFELWTEVTLGYSVDSTLTVTNVGTGALDIYEIKLLTDPDSAFGFTEIKNLTLQPTEFQTYYVATDLALDHSLDVPSVGQIRIRSSDPNCDQAVVPMMSFPEGYTGTDSTSMSAATPADPCQ